MQNFIKLLISFLFIIAGCSKSQNLETSEFSQICEKQKSEILLKCSLKCAYVKSNKVEFDKCVNNCSVNVFGEKMPVCV